MEPVVGFEPTTDGLQNLRKRSRQLSATPFKLKELQQHQAYRRCLKVYSMMQGDASRCTEMNDFEQIVSKSFLLNS